MFREIFIETFSINNTVNKKFLVITWKRGWTKKWKECEEENNKMKLQTNNNNLFLIVCSNNNYKWYIIGGIERIEEK